MIDKWFSFYRSKYGYIMLWLFIYIIIVMLASTIFIYEIPLPENKLTISKVEYLPSSANSPTELPENNWHTTTLPDDWQKRNSETNYNVWYRGKINIADPPQQLWALFIPALKMNAAVYLNGTLLGSGGRLTDPVARNWMTPLLFSAPDRLFITGENTIHIRVKSDPPGTGKLSSLYLGPYHALEQAYNVHYYFRISSIQIITSILLSMGFFIGLLWLIRRKESYYGYYALAVIIWGIHNFNIFITDIPISTRLWDWLTYITITYYTLIAMIFTHRFLNKEHPSREKWLVTIGLFTSILLILLNDKDFYKVIFTLWYPATFALGLYVLVYTCFEAWKQKKTELQLLTTIGAITLLYAMHDLLVMHGIVDWQDGYYIQYSAAVLLIMFSIILVRRFAYSLNEVDQLNLNLEKRVKEKQLELEKNYLALRKIEESHIRTEERERITRDIHDGMGSHLVSILVMIKSGNPSMESISRAIQYSLNDLRLMIDSMDMGEDDLNTILGMFRMRVEPQLKNSQIKLEWKIEDIPPIPNFGPREAINITRILQEAITNTIKHAHADSIYLATYYDNVNGQPTINVVVSDNGKGFLMSENQGHGLKNMHYRVKEIGGSLIINSDSSGTKIHILLPTIISR